MNPRPTTSHLRPPRFRQALLLAALPALIAPAAFAQASATTTPPKPEDEKKSEAVVLSPFEVRPEDDTGYQAANTTSGSRLATSLKDTAASISPFTPEFLSDIAATNVTEMLAYATNAELNAGDAEGAGFNNPRDINSAGGEPFRIRGIPANTSVDYVENATPVDFYNIERAEVASGANSILFGSGDAGGLVSLQTKKAKLDRSRYSGSLVVGDWGYTRLLTDVNQVIVPKTLAFRLNALYQNAGSWREYVWGPDQNRYTAGVTYRPFSKTTISASYEDGVSKKSVGLGWNVSDQYTVWNATGRSVAETVPANGAALGLLSYGANQRFTYFGGDGVVYNMRNELRTTTAPSIPAQTLLSPSIFPYDVNWAGPEVQLHQSFNNSQVVIEQQLIQGLTLQAAWYHNETDANARSFVYQGNVMDLLGDPNPTLPATNGTGTVANPHARQVYLEASQNGDRTLTENEVKRATVVYQFDAGRWFGRHGVFGMWENAVQDRNNRSKREILVNQNNAPVQNVAAPENAQNLVIRRSYLVEGDTSTYALRGLYDPIAPFSYLGNTLSPREVTTGELLSRKDVDSFLLGAQSTWFNRPSATWFTRFSTTLGYRKDKIAYYDTTSGRVAAGDPRIASGERILNEVSALPGWNRNDITAKTKTFGGVLQVTKRFSVLYNQSSNIGAPRFDRRILPDGRIPPTPEGENKEYGVMIDLLGDDRYFARINYFDTKQVGDAAVSPSGAVTNNTSALGRPQVLRVLDAFVAAGRMTQAESDLQRFNWNAAIIDTATTGYELELVANPTRNWTIRAGYSKSERGRENFFAEGRTFFAQKFQEWRTMAGNDAALRAVVETAITEVQENEIDDRAAAQEQGFGSIPHKINVSTRYNFREGVLRGMSTGASLRYQGKVFAQRDTVTDREYWSNESIYVDAFAKYAFKLNWKRAQMSVQFNVKNLTNSYLATTARWNGDFSGARRIYLRDPRSYRLTTSIEF